MVDLFLEILNSERAWSWSVIGILYVVAAFSIRGFFLNPFKVQLDNLDKQHHSAIKKIYFRKSLMGWIFFFIPMIALIVFWLHPEFFIVLPRKVLLVIDVAAVLLVSILFHLQAFGVAALCVLKNKEVEENHSSKNIRNQ